MKRTLNQIIISFVLISLTSIVGCKTTSAPPQPVAHTVESLELSTEYSALDSNNPEDMTAETDLSEASEWNEDYQ